MVVLEDLPYEIKKIYGKRITKTAVFVAAFTAYLWEFQHKGQDSLLYKQLIEADHARLPESGQSGKPGMTYCPLYGFHPVGNGAFSPL